MAAIFTNFTDIVIMSVILELSKGPSLFWCWLEGEQFVNGFLLAFYLSL